MKVSKVSANILIDEVGNILEKNPDNPEKWGKHRMKCQTQPYSQYYRIHSMDTKKRMKFPCC